MNIKTYNNFVKNGFCVINLFSKKNIDDLTNQLVKEINLKLVGNKFKFTKKNLANFHKVVLNNNSLKKVFDSKKRYIELKKNIIEKLNCKNLSSFLNQLWRHNNKKIVWIGNPKLKEIKYNKAGYRIFVPSKKKNNIKKSAGFPHIDAYSLKNNNFITLWIPLIGFSEKYTMMIAPKSHIKLHSKNKFAKKKNYISRILSKNYSNKFNFVRPRLNKGQVIIHHPNVIHSGGLNIGTKTRVSIEIRLFDQKKFDLKKNFDPKLFN